MRATLTLAERNKAPVKARLDASKASVKRTLNMWNDAVFPFTSRVFSPYVHTRMTGTALPAAGAQKNNTASRPGISLPRGIRLAGPVAPMLATPVPEPFDSAGHLYEVLWDGIRTLAFVDDGRVRLRDRWGSDITRRYPELASMPAYMRETSAVLDGAIVCLDEDGRPDFSRLRLRLGADRPVRLAAEAPATFQAFDILYRRGQSLAGWPLRRRKEMLLALVRDYGGIGLPDWVERDGVAFFEAARDHGLAGIVAKKADSRYTPGERSSSWLKVRVYERDEFVVGGFAVGGRWLPGRSKRPRTDVSLMLGRPLPDGRLTYVGEVSGNFEEPWAAALMDRAENVVIADSPFAEPPNVQRLVYWCRPDIVVSIRHAGIVEGRPRFPVLEGARPDVPVEACREED
jgi:bifunctional non-homologous end joining protein LigD